MRKALILFFLSFYVLMFVQAEVVFEKRTINFGTINSGDNVQVDFKFKNVGDTVLVLKNISTSCGCTAAKIEKKEYKPGEEGIIPITFNSRGKFGRVYERIIVATNTKENLIRLHLEGKVIMKNFAVAEVDFKDRNIDFETVNVNTTYSRKIKIKNSGKKFLRITKVSHSPEVIPSFSRIYLDPGEEGEISINFTPVRKGRFSTFFTIETSAYKGRYITILIKAEIEEAAETEED
jgi:hypothetical protein